MFLLGDPLPRRVAIVRALHLGDLLCAVPAFRALRAALPEAEIALVGLPWARVIVERFSYYLDDLIEFPGFPGLPVPEPKIRELPDFFQRVHRRELDLAIQMHGSGASSNPFTMLLGARVNAGYYLPDHYCPDRRRFMAYPDHEPEVRRHLRLMEMLGVPLQGDELEFPVWEEDLRALERLDEARDLAPGEYACIHAGARTVSRRWPPDRFAAVADALAVKGLRVALTGGASEAGITRAVARAMRAPAIDLAGKTTLEMLAAMIKHARLVVCNDTGVSHLCAAVRAPSIVIVIASDPHRWAPLDRELHRLVIAGDMDRPPGVPVGRVLEQVEALLNETEAGGQRSEV